MFEIIIRDLETKEENVVKCEECVVIGITPTGEGQQESEVSFRSSIEHAAMAMADYGKVRAAARIGVAYYDGKRDVLDEERESFHGKLMESIKGALSSMTDDD